MTANALAQPNPDLLQNIGDIIQQRLEQFRDKWLPRDPSVRAALATQASGGKQPQRGEYQDIVDGLLEENRFLEKEAFTDPLTGHPNRNAFDAALKHIINNNSKAQAEGKEIQPTSIVFLDLNYLKQLNNISFGNGGDKAIKYLSDYVTKELRKPEPEDYLLTDKNNQNKGKVKHAKEGDLFARFGGDEFGIIMKGCTKEQADKKIRKIVEAMAKDSLNPDEKIGCHVIDDETKAKFSAQVSAAFGSAELLKELPEAEKTGNIEENIKKIMTLSMSAAQQAEKLDKSNSKKFAASIDGGVPQADDREEAEKVVRGFYEKKIDSAVFARKLVNHLEAKGGIVIPQIITVPNKIIVQDKKILNPSEEKGSIVTPNTKIIVPNDDEFNKIYSGAMQSVKPTISNQHSKMM